MAIDIVRISTMHDAQRANIIITPSWLQISDLIPLLNEKSRFVQRKVISSSMGIS